MASPNRENSIRYVFLYISSTVACKKATENIVLSFM